MTLQKDILVRLLLSRTSTSMRLVAAVLMALVVFVANSASSLAQKEKPKEIAKPVVVFNLASIDRVLGHANFLFKEIDRPELMDLVGVQLANIRDFKGVDRAKRSEEHTSELQSHSFISYAVFCLKKKEEHTS